MLVLIELLVIVQMKSNGSGLREFPDTTFIWQKGF